MKMILVKSCLFCPVSYLSDVSGVLTCDETGHQIVDDNLINSDCPLEDYGE